MLSQEISINQLEFFTTQICKVHIIPYFSESELYLMSGICGPFKAGQQIMVPFWLAITLKEKSKCKILPPIWMTPDALAKLYQKQKKQEIELDQLPHNNFFEISYILLKRAHQDIDNYLKVKNALQDIQAIRNQKIKKLFQKIKGPIKTKNLTSYQINKRRVPLSKMMESYHSLVPYEQKKKEEGD